MRCHTRIEMESTSTRAKIISNTFDYFSSLGRSRPFLFRTVAHFQVSILNFITCIII